MRAGPLRFKVDVERAVETKNETGEVEQEWEAWKIMRVDILPLRGEERFTAKQVKADVDTKIIARSSAARGVTPKMRLVELKAGERKYYDIESVIDARNRGVMTEFHCKEAR